MINEVISVDAGPGVAGLEEFAAAAKAAAAEFKASFGNLTIGGAGGGPGKLVAQWQAAADEVEAAAARMSKAVKSAAGAGDAGKGAAAGLDSLGASAGAAAAEVKGLGAAGDEAAAGLSKITDAGKSAAEAAAAVGKSSTTAADGIKGLGDTTKTSSAWLDEYNATLAESAAVQKDFAKVSSEANAKIALGQRLSTSAARDASADAIAAHKAQSRAAADAAAGAEASSKKHSTALLGIAAAAGYGIYKAAALQTQVTRLYTSAGESQKNLPMMTQGILRLSGQTDTSQSELAQGAYMIESAGFHGKNALPVLKAAAQGAQAEGAPLGEVGNALTSLMISYGMKPGQATSAMNQIITMVGSGKMTMQGATGALPNLLPAASKAGLSFGQAGGALATMTQTGMSPDQAAQNLAHTIGALQNPSHVQTLEMQQLGIDSVKLSKNLGKEGLTGAISQVETGIMRNMGPAGTVLLKSFNASKLAARSATQEIAAMPPSLRSAAKAYLDGSTSSKAWRTELQGLPAIQANVLKQFAGTADAAHGFNNQLRAGGGNAQTFAAAMSKAMGGTVGMRTALMLGGSHMGTFKANADAIAASAQHAGQNVKGWDDIQKNFNFRLGQFKYSAEAAATTVGDSLLPAATGVMHVLAGAGSFLADHPAVTKAVAGAGGILGASYAIQRVARPVTTAVQGVGKVAQVLHIPGLDKLAGIGKGAGLDGAASSLGGAGASLKGAAAELSGAAAKLGGEGLAGAAGKAGGAAAGAEGAAAGAAEGEAAAAGASRFKGPAITAGAGALAALTIVDPVLRSMKSGPGGKNWFENPFGMAGPHDKASAGNWLTSFAPYERLFRQTRAPATPAGIPAGAAPAVYSRFGSSAAPQAAPVVKPKVAAPDTSAVSGAAAKIKAELDGALGAVTGKKVKLPAPDMSGLQSAKGKAQADAQAITSAITGALGKAVHAKSPDLSAYASAAGKARADGANISAGLASGILAGEGAVVAAASAVASAAAAAMSKAIQSRSPSKVTEKTGKEFDAGFVVGLQGGQPAINAAATAIGKSAAKAADIASIDNYSKKLLAQVPKGDTALTKMLKADNRQLDQLAGQRAKLEAEITDATQITQSAISGSSIMNSTSAVNPAGNEPLSSAGIIQGQQYQLQTQQQFTQQIQKLKKMGLNPAELNQLVQGGAVAGLPIAQGIASGGQSAVNQLNSIQGKLKASAAQLGNTAAPAMYQAGKDAAAGIADGLKADLKQVDKAMEKIAKQMVAAVGKTAKTTKAAAKKAASGAVPDGTSAAGAASSGAEAATPAGGGKGLGSAAASLSAAGASLSGAAAALSAAAAAFKKDAGKAVAGTPHPVAHPVATSGGYPLRGTPVRPGGGYAGGSGGVTIHVHNTTVNVAGTVTAERNLLDSMQGRQLTRSNNNWQSGWNLPNKPR